MAQQHSLFDLVYACAVCFINFASMATMHSNNSRAFTSYVVDKAQFVADLVGHSDVGLIILVNIRTI